MGAMKTYEVANVQEAVELGHELKAQGLYDWFRGQVKEEWPPVSSMNRARTGGDVEQETNAFRRITMFGQWVKSIPELRYLLEKERVNDFFAIMQHYGIPTDYVDFTTDPGVAGFFAADTKTPPSDAQSCILCLNSEDLMSHWEILKTLEERQGASIELIRVDVRNLWRLQAQKGIFLYVTYNWQIDYSLDRIVFPYSGYPSYPTRELIYPEDKSPLEQLLDQYFALEKASFAYDEMQELVEQIQAKGGNASMSTWNTFTGGFYAEAFIDEEQLVLLDSWKGLQGWDIDPEEDYHQTVGGSIKLSLKGQSDPNAIGKSVAFGVKQVLLGDPSLRSKSVAWLFIDASTSIPTDELTNTLRPLWNGMRRLPYRNEEIADAFGSVAALVAGDFDPKAERKVHEQQLSNYFGGEVMYVEFSNQDNSGSRAFVVLEGLRKALGRNFSELLSDERQNFANLPKLFRAIYNPRLMFDFDALKGLFARQIIPTQVLLKRDVLVTNPASLKHFGLP